MDRLESLGNTLSQMTVYDIKSYYNQAKNMVLNLSEMEVKVREATNDEAWGASSTLMNEIAQGTFSFQTFNEIMPAIYARFMEKEAKQWRQIYKALQLLEYLIKNGSERTVDDARSHISTIKMLRNFHYIDEKGKDQGINVRNRAKEIVELLSDLDKVRSERRKAKSNKNKYTGTGNDGEMNFPSDSGGRYGGFGNEGLYGSGGGSSGRYDPDSSYGNGGGGGGGGGGFRDDAPNKKFQEYDAGEDEDLPPRTSTSSARRKNSTSTSTAAAAAPPPKLKAKAPEADLLGGLMDEPEPPLLPAKPSGGGAGLDDDFGDFEAAPSSQAQTKPNVFEFLSQTQIQQPQQQQGHARQLSGGGGFMGGGGGMGFGSPPMQPQAQQQRQASFTTPMMGMGGASQTIAPQSLFGMGTTPMQPQAPRQASFSTPMGGMQPPAPTGGMMTPASLKPTTTTTTAPKPQPSKSSGFDDLWSMSVGSAAPAIKPSAGGGGGGGGKSIQQLEKEKAQAGIWGTSSTSSNANANAFGNFGGSTTGGGDDNLLL